MPHGVTSRGRVAGAQRHPAGNTRRTSRFRLRCGRFLRRCSDQGGGQRSIGKLLKNSRIAQYSFIGAHGDGSGLAAFSDSKESATWNEVWNWYAQGNLKGGLWLGACKSSYAASGFSHLLARGGALTVSYVYGRKRHLLPTYLWCLVFYRAWNREIQSDADLWAPSSQLLFPQHKQLEGGFIR